MRFTLIKYVKTVRKFFFVQIFIHVNSEYENVKLRDFAGTVQKEKNTFFKEQSYFFTKFLEGGGETNWKIIDILQSKSS